MISVAQKTILGIIIISILVIGFFVWQIFFSYGPSNPVPSVMGYNCRDISDSVALENNTILFEGQSCPYTVSSKVGDAFYLNNRDRLEITNEIILDNRCNYLEAQITPHGKITNPNQGMFMTSDSTVYWCNGQGAI
ncbi:MAG: hypothetical protein IPJ89_01605 [Candidatus Iainarchaeum archaeon]|uniref:Uncharacterized protein n=1 Tax=Candidatus Iainarchaeum sp. TaxID=3101447 RepID=A0A7T9DKD7_9ARCH|nr:MAG: hypothetical protein IPJ89_01605 [Candidatus Diapherotrites archaeon]